MRSKVRIRVQTIHWGQLAGKARVLPNPCGGSVLHRSEIYLWVHEVALPCKGSSSLKKKKNYKFLKFNNLGLLNM
jgi:hypothetical protein